MSCIASSACWRSCLSAKHATSTSKNSTTVRSVRLLDHRSLGEGGDPDKGTSVREGVSLCRRLPILNDCDWRGGFFGRDVHQKTAVNGDIVLRPDIAGRAPECRRHPCLEESHSRSRLQSRLLQ